MTTTDKTTTGEAADVKTMSFVTKMIGHQRTMAAGLVEVTKGMEQIATGYEALQLDVEQIRAEEFRKGFEAGEVNSALLNEDVRRVVRRLCGRIIASAHLLDVPFTDAPDQSPWTRMKRDMAALHEAVGIRFANLPNEGGE